jgi:hypothetical protein
MEREMSEINQSVLNQRWLLRVVAWILLGLLIFVRIGYGQTRSPDSALVILQGSTHLQPIQSVPGGESGQIQPGTAVKLTVTVENKGQLASPPGELFVRYAFARPLEKEAISIIFETEKQSLPSIEPGGEVDIHFKTTHQIPSLLDFVRYDWSMREYQAIAMINEEENMIGTLAITFSAYYYPGIKKELPTKISP